MVLRDSRTSWSSSANGHRLSFNACATGLVALCMSAAVRAGDDPYADTVIDHVAGAGGSPGYDDPATTLGSPERMTGEQFGFPGVVSGFSPPFGSDEILSIGIGGSLVLQFDTPVTDDPDNLHGIDLIVFGNTGFIDASYPDGIVGSGLFGADGGTIEVSADGSTWLPIGGVAADGPHPTIGYADAGPYDTTPGVVPTDFTRPVDPLLEQSDLVGHDHASVTTLYRGAGGGVGVDLAGTGLAAISYIRIGNPADAVDAIEIDAVADAAPRVPGDVNLDDVVNIEDLLDLLAAWGPVTPGGTPADFDGDGLIATTDLLVLLAGWTTP